MDRLDRALWNLERRGYIEQDSVGRYKLTEKGWQYHADREMREAFAREGENVIIQ